MSFKNKASIVIPTYNREKLLLETLESLTEQTVNKDQYEVIVVDDGSIDNTKELVNSFKGKLDIRYFFQEDKGFRVALARNTGIKEAKNEIIILLDSGIIAPENLIESHLIKYETSRCDALVGFSYGFDEFEVKNADSLINLYRNNDRKTAFKLLSENDQWADCRIKYLKENYDTFKKSKNKFMVFWTCHVSVKKSVIMSVGMFDENFNKWGGEDVELAIRLSSSGFEIDLLFEPLVLHLPHEKVKSSVIESSETNIFYIKEKHIEHDLTVLDLGWKDL